MKVAVILLTIALSCTFLSAEYTKLEWSDCGSKEVVFENLSLEPMPIIQPGDATLNFQANLKRALSGSLKTELKIVRSVSGIKLPIRCYKAGGVSVGSCKYSDLCTIVETLLPGNFNPSVCPPELAPFGIDCTCPFNLKAGPLDISNQVLNLPDASQTIATFLASGDFDINIKLADSVGSISCVNIGFSVRPR